LLHGRTTVTTGALDTPGQLTVDGNFNNPFFFPAITVGTIGGTAAPSGITLSGGSVTTGGVTGAGNISLTAIGGGGLLTVGGAVTTADGKTISLQSSGGTPFQFPSINAGATGTVNITSALGIQQTADGGGNGITARTVSLSSSTGPITNTADSTNLRLDLLGTTNLTVNTGGTARFDAHGSVLTDLAITKTALPATAPFELFGLGGGQSATIQLATSPMEVAVNSGTALTLRLDTSALSGTNMTLVGGGIATGGGNVNLSSGA